MQCKVLIIGAGVVGLCIAKSLCEDYDDIYLIEKDVDIGLGISSRNSEVIHSGVYYPNDSLKMKLCVQGRKMLYEYCEKNNVKYNKCGKLIIGHDYSDSIKLINIRNNALDYGVHSDWLNKECIQQMEPNIDAEYALYFPESGVIDSHGLMKQLFNEISNNNVSVVLKTIVKNILINEIGFEVIFENPDGSEASVSTEIIINSAGLYANYVSNLVGIKDQSYELSYWKGEYCWVSNSNSNFVNSLIYPLPGSNVTGLGIHTTIDINNRLKLGPNALYKGENLIEDYSLSEDIIKSFYISVKKYIPHIKLDDIHLDQAGIRPKLQKPGEPFRDFVIVNEEKRGYKNFINLIGIESPGLTASLAIGDYVKKLILR